MASQTESAISAGEKPTTSAAKSGKILQGKRKSGRVWKDTKKKNDLSHKMKPLKSSWQRKMGVRAKDLQTKLLQQEIRDNQQREKQERIERRKEQEQRRLENERKSEVVQVIKNASKLKKTKKRQLRKLEMRDIS